MAKYHIRDEFLRLHNGENYSDRLDSFNNVVDTAFKILYEDQKRTYKTQFKQEANLLYQMTIMKCLSLQKLIDGIYYTNPISKLKFTGLYDTFSIYSVIRSVFESICIFNNIYIFPIKEESKMLLYYLWVISGLKYRQRFESNVVSQKGEKKLKEESEEIKKAEQKIYTNSYFISLPKKEQKKIGKALNNNKFQFYFENDIIFFAPWAKMFENMGVNDIFRNAYTDLSLNTHPSNVSVFKFRDMYDGHTDKLLSYIALDQVKVFISFIIRDYITLFPGNMITFNNLPEVNQMIINSYNRMFRGAKYQLNDIESYV